VTAFSGVEKLRADHVLDAFDCGDDSLNRFIKRHALPSQLANSAQTYVVRRSGSVVGFYSLTAGSVTHESSTERMRKGLARHPIPVVLLARFAVDSSAQGQGLGSALLKDALLRVSRAADIIGARALLVHAKDDEARAFYSRYDFDPSPTDPYQLCLVMKDLKRLLR